MKTIMSIIAGLMVGVIFVVGSYMIGATMAGADPIEQMSTMVSVVSRDIQYKMDDVEEEVDHQIWRIETTSKIEDSFGDKVAEVFWDLTR